MLKSLFFCAAAFGLTGGATFCCRYLGTLLNDPFTVQGAERCRRRARRLCGTPQALHLCGPDRQILPHRISSAGRERLAAEFELHNPRATKGRFNYAIELIDDRGKRPHKPIVARPSDLESAATTKFGRYDSPADLPDGFYQLRISVAHQPDGAPGVTAADTLYFQKTADKIVPLDVNDYFMSSPNARLPTNEDAPVNSDHSGRMVHP